MLLQGTGGESSSTGAKVQVGAGGIQLEIVRLSLPLANVETIPERHQLGAEALEALLQVNCLIG